MKKNKKKVVFFDFCGTLVPFQSAEMYVNYVIIHTDSIVTKFRHKLYKILRRLHIVSRLEYFSKGIITNKKLMLYQIKGISQARLDILAQSFFHEIIVPNLIPEMIVKLREYQKQNYKLVIVSGGLDVYLHYVMQYFGGSCDDLFATTLIFREGKFTGKMGFDCMGENKIVALQKKYKIEDIYSVAYSDSDTDYPLLSWVDHGYYVIPIAHWIDGIKISSIEYKNNYCI